MRMSTIAFSIILLLANLTVSNSAYRTYRSDDPNEGVFIPYEEYIYLINLKQTLKNNNCLKACNLQPPLMIGEPSRRDTHFLRFGRKR